jgi:hypothetical protein
VLISGRETGPAKAVGPDSSSIFKKYKSVSFNINIYNYVDLLKIEFLPQKPINASQKKTYGYS